MLISPQKPWGFPQQVKAECEFLTQKFLYEMKPEELEGFVHLYSTYRAFLQDNEFNEVAEILEEGGQEFDDLAQKVDNVEGWVGIFIKQKLMHLGGDRSLLSETPHHGYFLTLMRVLRAAEDEKYEFGRVFEKAEVADFPGNGYVH